MLQSISVAIQTIFLQILSLGFILIEQLVAAITLMILQKYLFRYRYTLEHCIGMILVVIGGLVTGLIIIPKQYVSSGTNGAKLIEIYQIFLLIFIAVFILAVNVMTQTCQIVQHRFNVYKYVAVQGLYTTVLSALFISAMIFIPCNMLIPNCNFTVNNSIYHTESVSIFLQQVTMRKETTISIIGILLISPVNQCLNMFVCQHHSGLGLVLSKIMLTLFLYVLEIVFQFPIAIVSVQYGLISYVILFLGQLFFFEIIQFKPNSNAGQGPRCNSQYIGAGDNPYPIDSGLQTRNQSEENIVQYRWFGQKQPDELARKKELQARLLPQ